MKTELHHYIDPDPALAGETVLDMLNNLAGPSSILLTGEDPSRCRAIVTLLHGNEPSGSIALHRWIKSGKKPAMNILCILASVEAALTEPQLTHRVLPSKRDLNRCFAPPHNDEPGTLAKNIVARLQEFNPEAIIDVHNTSGSGPAFGVCIYEDQFHDRLAALFTHRLIVTDIRLGAIMEITEYVAPTITIECGGRLDDSAHQIVWEGLCRYCLEDNILDCTNIEGTLEILTNPVRLELKPECSLTYSNLTEHTHNLIMDPAIERLNTGITEKNTVLGRTDKSCPTELFVAKNSAEQCILEHILLIEDNQLKTNRNLKLFMVTSNAAIAKMDCLFYAVEEDGTEILLNR